MPTPVEKCSQLGIPSYLHKSGREPDPQFGSKVELYRWYRPGLQHLPTGMLTQAAWGRAFRDPHDTSVQRGDYCQDCTDALYDYKGGNHRTHCGVMASRMDCIQSLEPKQVEWTDHKGNSVTKEYTFVVTHKPEECMYPHSVIAVYENGEQLNTKPSARTAKNALRALLAGLFRNRHNPGDEVNL